MSNKGFTLIELIVVIILISILAVTVVPKFLSSKGFEEYSYRDELIVKLRAIQLRTMQQTDGNVCHNIKVEASEISLLETVGTACGTGNAGESTTVTITNDHVVSFSISGGLSNFSFSSLGRPEAVGCGDATTLCSITLTVSGESDLVIEINQEGFIHAV